MVLLKEVKDVKSTVRGKLFQTLTQWVVSITPCTGGDWLHIAQCLSGNDLVDSADVWVDQSQERELLGRR